MENRTMKIVMILVLSALALTQEPNVRKEHWGMTQNEVIAAEKSPPLKRNDRSLVYGDKESGIPSQVLFEFTKGRLDQISYVLDSPSPNSEAAFLTCVLISRCDTGNEYFT
jgi:hypothetical protein